MSYYSDLAEQYQGMAADIEDHLSDSSVVFSTPDYTTLKTRRDGLLNKATEIIAADIQQTLDNLQVDKTTLQSTTGQLKAAIKTIQKADKLIALASAALTLATGIATANPGTVASGIEAATKALSTKTTPSAPTESKGGLSLAAAGDSDTA
jgi:hypothetical protein